MSRKKGAITLQSLTLPNVDRFISGRPISLISSIIFSISARNQTQEVKYTSICIAHRRNYLKCAQTWITQFYLQITPCLRLLPSSRASPPFGWYSFYRPTEGRRLSRPGWLVTYRNKVPPPGVEPGHSHPSQY